MNSQLTIYTYTADRLKEFNKIKSEKDIIITALALLDEENSIKFEEDKRIFIDITNVYRSIQESNPLSVEKIIYQISKNNNFYILINTNSLRRFKEDFGQFIEKEVPINNIYKKEDTVFDFSNLSNEQIQLLEQNLNTMLYGHKEFKKDLIQQIKNYSILYKLKEIKIMSLLICGESGTGKTEVARVIHNTFYKDTNMIKINLGNYKTQGALNSLIGSPKGYLGSGRGGELSNKIKNSDSKIILIDEFEKADSDIFNFFYELLEDGKFTDLNENEYDLNGYLIIFTSNLNDDNYKNIIPAPLLSRFTMKTLFEPVSFEEKSKYVRDRSKKLVGKYNEEYDGNMDYKSVLAKINNKDIKSIKNFRYLNRIIQLALIKEIEEKENENE